MFIGIPRFPVLPMIAATVAIECSFGDSKSFFATITETKRSTTTMPR